MVCCLFFSTEKSICLRVFFLMIVGPYAMIILLKQTFMEIAIWYVPKEITNE